VGQSIRDIMTANPRTIEPSTPIFEAARIMRDDDIGSLPITDGDQLWGTITDRDITIRAIAEGRDPQGTTVQEIASRDLITIDPQQGMDEALRLMAQHQIRRLPVVEEDGRLIGIVAQADVAQVGDDARTGETVQQISQ
jgi:CBS domain-containing protein